MYCGNCGSQLQDDDKFCMNCGQSVSESSMAESTPHEETDSASNSSNQGISRK